MTDIVDSKTRSRMMSGIKGKNTKIELQIRKSLFSRGHRYRLHNSSLPGRPDLVFPKYKAVIFVNGCFWHGHQCNLFKWPKTRQDFWKEKITGNIARDSRNIAALEQMDYRVLTVWECAIRGKNQADLDKVIGEIDQWICNGDQEMAIP